MPGNYKDIIHYEGMFDCARKILKYEGMTAFYKGLTPNIIKIFPSSGVFFLTYELTLKAFQNLNI